MRLVIGNGAVKAIYDALVSLITRAVATRSMLLAGRDGRSGLEIAVLADEPSVITSHPNVASAQRQCAAIMRPQILFCMMRAFAQALGKAIKPEPQQMPDAMTRLLAGMVARRRRHRRSACASHERQAA
jgi:hypothetical protein